MTANLTRHIIGIVLSVMFFAGTGFAADATTVEKFVKARIDISEMMMNYFSDGEMFRGREAVARADARNERRYQHET